MFTIFIQFHVIILTRLLLCWSYSALLPDKSPEISFKW